MKSILRAHLAVIAIGIALFVGLCIFGIECDNFIDYFQVQWGSHFLGGLHQIYRFSTPFLLGCIAAGLIGLWRHASSDFTVSVSIPSIFLNAAITGILTAATDHFLFRCVFRTKSSHRLGANPATVSEQIQPPSRSKSSHCAGGLKSEGLRAVRLS